MGWGTAPWGTSAWGLGASAVLEIEAAFAVGPRRIRVTLSRDPRQIGEFEEGGVFNPTVWAVTRDDSGANIVVLQVESHNPPRTFDLLTLEPLASHNVTHSISAIALTAADGTPASIAAFSVRGSLPSEPTRHITSTPNKKRGLVDIKSSYVPIDDQLGGGWVVAGGDYDLHGGNDVLRKLIIRRLLTAPGSFPHLPNYGLGLRVKESMPGGTLVKLKHEIEQQVEREPELVDVRAILTHVPQQNMLIIEIRATTADGQDFKMSYRAGPNPETF